MTSGPFFSHKYEVSSGFYNTGTDRDRIHLCTGKLLRAIGSWRSVEHGKGHVGARRAEVAGTKHQTLSECSAESFLRADTSIPCLIVGFGSEANLSPPLGVKRRLPSSLGGVAPDYSLPCATKGRLVGSLRPGKVRSTKLGPKQGRGVSGANP